MPIRVTHSPVDRETEYKLEDFPVLSIGRFSYIHGQALVHYFGEKSRVRIGQFCSIAENTSFFLRTNHRSEWITTYPIEAFPWAAAQSKPQHPHIHAKADIVIGSD